MVANPQSATLKRYPLAFSRSVSSPMQRVLLHEMINSDIVSTDSVLIVVT